MLWILLDLAIVLVAMGVLAALVLGLWRRVKALTATVAAAGESIASATDALEAAQASGPPSTAGASPARRPPGA